MSAVDESADGPIPVIQVLFALHPSFGAQELCGPLEVLSSARHKINDPGRARLLFTTPFRWLLTIWLLLSKFANVL